MNKRIDRIIQYRAMKGPWDYTTLCRTKRTVLNAQEKVLKM
jgi:hypothetical protein